MFTLFNLQGALGDFHRLLSSELAHYISADLICQELFSEVFDLFLIALFCLSSRVERLLIIHQGSPFVNRKIHKIMHKPCG